VRVIAGDTLTETWGGIEIEWEHLPRAGGPGAGPGLVADGLLAHLAVLAGGRRDDGEDERW
jgi:hypothetical protein